MDSPGLANSQSLLMSRSTFDELAMALTACSRAPSPDPVSLSCCCKRDDCEYCQAWLDLRSTLEEKLNLAAKVGQALLEKHEAYVRNHTNHSGDARFDELQSQMTQLEAENKDLDQQLKFAQEHSLLLESAHTTTLSSLENANTEITRLTTLTARSAGWEGKLRTLQNQNEDLLQELEYARKTETRVTSLEANCERLMEENGRLRGELSTLENNIRAEREASARDARVRLENLLASIPRADPDVYTHNQEVIKILENLVADNEALKRANAESANLLAETREELRSAMSRTEEEDPLPEIDIVPSPSRRPRGLNLNHRSSASITSFASIQRRKLSRHDTDSSNHSTRRSSPESSRYRGSSPEATRYSRLHLPSMLQLPDDDSSDAVDSQGKPKSPMRTLMLLTRERGVQTDPYSYQQGSPHQTVSGHLSPTLFMEGVMSSQPSTSTAHSIHSSNSDRDATSFSPSSITQSLSHPLSPMTALTATLAGLLAKLKQADIETIYGRLRRQHLSITKESLRHISESTMKTLDTSVRELVMPSHGPNLDGERARWEGAWVSRDEWRTLLGWCRSVLMEGLTLRSQVNDTDLKEFGKEKEGSAGWIKPISRLFSSGGNTEASTGVSSSNPPSYAPPHLHSPKPIRAAPKLQPALAPSTTTVNVEFTGAGVRHSTPNPETQMVKAARMQANAAENVGSIPKLQAVKGIFAGSRMPSMNDTKDWVVLPKKTSRTSFGRPGSSSGLGRGTVGTGPGPEFSSPTSIKRGRRMSRALEAILDGSGEHDYVGDGIGAVPDEGEDKVGLGEEDVFHPGRPLRPRGRGLSDSSIHTTFMNHGVSATSGTSQYVGDPVKHRPSVFPISIIPDRASVLQALSQRVQNLASSVSGSSSSGGGVPGPIQTPSSRERERGRALLSSSPRMGYAPRNPSRGRDGLM